MKTIVEKHRVGAKVTVESLTFQKGLNFYSLRFYPTHFLLDPCDIQRHVGRRDNAIYLLWEMKSIAMQKYFIVLSSNMALCRRGYCKQQQNKFI